jgi:hypothetical protein
MALMSTWTECPCGQKLQSRMKKPTWYEHSIAKLVCKVCGSRFLLSCVREKSEDGSRVFRSHIDILELSDEAKQIVSSRASFKAKKAVAQVKNAIGLDPFANDGDIVETKLD